VIVVAAWFVVGLALYAARKLSRPASQNASASETFQAEGGHA